MACSFDIESTSFYEDVRTGETFKDNESGSPFLEKRACMYAWIFGINGRCVTGRTWNQFLETCKRVKDYFGLDHDGLRLVCYVHNLAFEFQWFKHLFEWESVFSTKERTPLKAVTSLGIEFRCSLLLSGYSLAKVGEHLQRYKVAKLVGDLDYDLLRHSKTPLTRKEWGYIVNDALVVMAYVQELLDDRKRITRLPLTKTGFVREFIRNRCFWDENAKSHRKDYSGKYRAYRMMMENLTINGIEEFAMLKSAFQGAIVHANFLNANKTLHDVASYDFTSSYPSCMVAEKYPMSKGTKVKPKSIEEFKTYLKCYLSIFEVTFFGLDSTTNADHVISFSKTLNPINAEIDNGRVINADRITMTITNIDLETYSKFYRWKRMDIGKMYVYRKNYLPTDFVKAVLDLYRRKTELKGVVGKEAEYLWAKECANSSYGMSVCIADIQDSKITYDNEKGWIKEEQDINESIERYNGKKNRFLFFPWGVFITAYARRNLASGILECGHASGHYCYCDTDSVKILFADQHGNYFRKYNEFITEKLKRACAYHRIDYDTFCNPCDIKGKHHPLGVWDYEGTYKRAKFYGCKRYAVEYDDGSHSITIAGVNKKTAIPYLERESMESGNDFFDTLRFDFTFPKEGCGKLLHTYIDVPTKGILRDYRGIRGKYAESSSVHLEPTTYKMSVTSDYLDLLDSVTREEERFAG